MLVIERGRPPGVDHRELVVAELAGGEPCGGRPVLGVLQIVGEVARCFVCVERDEREVSAGGDLGRQFVDRQLWCLRRCLDRSEGEDLCDGDGGGESDRTEPGAQSPASRRAGGETIWMGM
jgi:hypothetical protein